MANVEIPLRFPAMLNATLRIFTDYETLATQRDTVRQKIPLWTTAMLLHDLVVADRISSTIRTSV